MTGIHLRRSASKLALVSALALAATACGDDGGDTNTAPASGGGDELGTLTVLSAGEGVQYMMPTLAEEQGYFEEEGLTVKFADSAAGGGDATAALTGGDVDVIQTGLPHVIGTNSQGLDLRAIAPSVEEYTLALVLSGEVLAELDVSESAAPVEKIKALAERGAKIGISSPGSSTDLFMRHLCKEADVSCDGDINLLPLGGIGESTAAFVEGQVDGLVRSHPDVDQALDAAGDGAVFVDGAKGNIPSLEGYLYVVMVTTDGRIEEKRPELVAFLRAVDRAMTYVQENPDEASAFAKAYSAPDISDELWSQGWEPMLTALPEDVTIDEAGVDKTFEVVTDLGLSEVGVEPSAVFTTELAEEAQSSTS